MKIKTDKIALPTRMEPLMQTSEDNPIAIIPEEDVRKNEAALQEYIRASREHLEGIKTELYKVLDAGYSDAKHYSINKNSTANFSVKPSVFLEKAYTVQTYDEHGEGMKNRDQPHIDAGTDFSTYCENASTLSNDQLLSNDAGKMIGAINSAISQLNKVEAKFVKAKTDEAQYEIAGGEIPVLKGCIDTVKEQARDSKLVKIVPNQNFIERALSGLSDIASKIGSFFSNLGKSQEQQNREKFTSFKDRYQAAARDPAIAAQTAPQQETESERTFSNR